METIKTVFEEIKVLGHELADKVKSLIHEGNVRRIIIKDEAGHTFVEIPVTVAAVGAVLAPVVAAVGRQVHHRGGKSGAARPPSGAVKTPTASPLLHENIDILHVSREYVLGGNPAHRHRNADLTHRQSGRNRSLDLQYASHVLRRGGR